jgi:hypothetical protein
MNAPMDFASGGLTMGKDYSRFLTGQMGESLVVAELGRHNIVATAFSGNLPVADILAMHGQSTLRLQVKAMRKETAIIGLGNLLNIEQRGPKQIVTKVDPLDDPDLIYVYVYLGDCLAHVRFYILTLRDLQDLIFDGYTGYLARNGGERPRNKESKHASVATKDLETFQGNWGLITDRLGVPSVMR